MADLTALNLLLFPCRLRYVTLRARFEPEPPLGFVAYNLFFKCPIDKVANLHSLEDLKESIRREINYISADELMCVNVHFLKKMPRNVWMKETTFPISHVIR